MSGDGPKVEIPQELAADLEAAEKSTDDPAGESADDQAGADASDLQAMLEDLNDKHLRLAAEFDNYKRRTLKDRQDLLNYATENLIKELLATVDNLERALGYAQGEEEGSDREKLSEGVELTYRSLLQALEKSGVKPVEAEGQQFDPKLHEALRQVVSDEHEPGAILEVYQKGYLLKDRLLRPALVSVAGPAEK